MTAPAGLPSPGGPSLLGAPEGLRTGLLLLPPMLWLGVAYLAALAALFITSLWSQNDFTGDIERVWTLRQLPAALGRSRSTARSRSARSGSRRW